MSLLLGFGVALYVFDRFATYEPTALSRVPEDAEGCVRVNLQQAVVYDPLTRFLLPLVERGREGPEPRIKHLERRTTLELAVDVRELVYVDLKEGEWLIIAAGFLRQDEVLGGILRMCLDEGIPMRREGATLVHPSGIVLGLAEDGTLLLGSRGEVVAAAQARRGMPSWAAPLQGQGVALGIYVSPQRSRPTSSAKSHLLGGSAVVLAETYFPVRARFLVDGDHWTEDQTDRLFASKKGDFTYLLPLEDLRTTRIEGAEIQAKSNLGRERFDGTIERLASRVDQLLPSAAKSAK